MILSNLAIHAALDSGRLVIKPEPKPRVASIDEPKCAYQTTSVDLRLGSELQFPREDKAFLFDLRKGPIAKSINESYKSVRIDRGNDYNLEPHRFVLGQTIEFVSFPILTDQTCLAGRVEGKSSLARCGLIIHLTAPTIHAGFAGKITLEMINLGHNSIVLYEGMDICQLIIEAVDGTPTEKLSQFHGQTRPSGVRQ